MSSTRHRDACGPVGGPPQLPPQRARLVQPDPLRRFRRRPVTTRSSPSPRDSRSRESSQGVASCIPASSDRIARGAPFPLNALLRRAQEGGKAGIAVAFSALPSDRRVLYLVRIQGSVSTLCRDALGRTEVALLAGHDIGASVAAWAALIRPDIFHELALMSAPFPGPPDISPQPPPARSIHAELAALDRPRKHYQWYYSTRQADTDMQDCPQGVHGEDPVIRRMMNRCE